MSKQELDLSESERRTDQSYNTLLIFYRLYSGDLNRELVWYSNGSKQFVPQLVRYSSHVLNMELIVCYSNGKNFSTESHLVTVLFTMAANQMIWTIQLATI